MNVLELIGAIAAVCLVAFMFYGIINFRKIRAKWDGIIGVGGAFLSMSGIIGAIMIVAHLVSVLIGKAELNAGGLIGPVIIVVLCAIPLVKAMMRCVTVKQRVMLPFVCFHLTYGFLVRFLLHIFAHVPMDMPETNKEDHS